MGRTSASKIILRKEPKVIRQLEYKNLEGPPQKLVDEGGMGD